MTEDTRLTVPGENLFVDQSVEQYVEPYSEPVQSVQVTLAKRIVRPGSNQVVCLAAQTSIPLASDEDSSVSDVALRLSDGTNLRLSLSCFNEAAAEYVPFARNNYDFDRYSYTVKNDSKLGVFLAATILVALAGFYSLASVPGPFRSYIASVPSPFQAYFKKKAPAKQPAPFMDNRGFIANLPMVVAAPRAPKAKRPKATAVAKAGKTAKKAPVSALVPPPPPITYRFYDYSVEPVQYSKLPDPVTLDPARTETSIPTLTSKVALASPVQSLKYDAAKPGTKIVAEKADTVKPAAANADTKPAKKAEIAKVAEVLKPKAKAAEVAAKPVANKEEIAAKPKQKASEVAAKPNGKAAEVAAKPKAKTAEIAAKPKAKAPEVAAKAKGKTQAIAAKAKVKAASIAEQKAKQPTVATKPPGFQRVLDAQKDKHARLSDMMSQLRPEAARRY